MAKKKVYAVRKGKQTGIFHTWEACKQAVYGYSGAVYKSFATLQEAEAYLNFDQAGSAGGQSAGGSGCMDKASLDRDSPDSGQNARLPEPDGITAYVDGSFEKKIGRYSYGCILLTPDGDMIKESGSGSEPEALALRNVTGEMMGAAYAVHWAVEHGYAAVNICYDYAGIEQWAVHGWQAKNKFTQKYTAFMDENRKKIAVSFTKIAAHTGDKYNEEADQLAKRALRDHENNSCGFLSF